MNRHRSKLQRARRHQRQEGIVMLVVMMLILMATSTGVWAMLSSVGEQKASTALVESSLAHSEAECSAMAGVALEEMGATPMDFDPAILTKYYLPTPPVGTVKTKDFADSNGGYGCGNRAQMRRAPWSLRARRLHETYTYGDVDEALPSGRSGSVVVITGYGELGLDKDPVDHNNQRGVHEVIAISRAYFDIRH